MMLQSVMQQSAQTQNYNPVGDITTLGLCLLMFGLMFQMHISKDKNFHLLMGMLGISFVAAAANAIMHVLIMVGTTSFWVYALRGIHNIALLLVLMTYLRYLQRPLWVRPRFQKQYHFISLSVFVLTLVADALGTIYHFGFFVRYDGSIAVLVEPYHITYMLYIVGVSLLVFQYRKRLIRQIFCGILVTNVIALVTLAAQEIFRQSSFTSVCCFLPVLSLLFLFHSNPYDINTGAISEEFFYEEISDSWSKRRTLVVMSITMQNFSKAIQTSKDLSDDFRQFFRRHMRNSTLYHFTNDRFILTVPKEFDTQQDEAIDAMIEDFQSYHQKHELDYKIVLLDTTPEVTGSEDYVRLFEYAENAMRFNSSYRISDADIKRFYSASYILSELEDIVQRRDLDDERVVVYCQPVFNINTGKYDTAEALMRLRLHQCGIVFPDQFIPIAERYNLIHALSLTILNKTCGAIRTLLEDGYDLSRISVNFSTLDIRYDGFCQEVQQIIDRNQIPYNKIAIEITESRSEYDFNIMKQKVIELQKLGIKFYLDDFGTGYSNFERIMEIPFDIIKFDRSLLIESGRSDSSKYMVSTFASMFNQLEYAILFEGIESDDDELVCVEMSAKYLQGYKYSKPIPIERLCEFLEKTTE